MEAKKLKALVDEFLVYKRSNGCIYAQGEYHLNKYMAFSAAACPDEVLPSRKSVELFLDKYVSAPGSLYNAASVIREFGRYLTARGHFSTYVIPAKRVKLPTPVLPYFFTSSEIASFFEVCDSIKNDPHVKGKHLILPAMYRLLYCCGLRCKEVRTLRVENVHLDKRYLDIRQSKGPKSRRIFIPEDLAGYLKGYDREIGILFPDRQTFFPNKKDAPYGAQMLERNFYRIWFKAFPEKEDSGISIRPYDFRHHFVYANMNRWLLEGKDVGAMLPYLMKYMGHSDIKNTLYYFHLVPDIYGAITEKSLSLESLIPEVGYHGKKDLP